MKHLLTALLSLTIAISSIAQDQVEGLGKFKIGKTTPDFMQEIAIERKVDIKEVNTRDKFSKARAKDVLEIKPHQDKLREGVAYASDCPQSRVFYLKEYEIAGITIKDLYLTFYNGVLIKLASDGSSEIEEAMRAKYGDVKSELETTKSSCGNTALENQAYRKYWRNGDIVATSSLSTYYSYNCQKNILFTFSIKSTLKSKEEGDCSKSSSGPSEQRKKELKDF